MRTLSVILVWTVLSPLLCAGTGGAPETGSLLLFPIYDSTTAGSGTTISVTNTNLSPTSSPVKLHYFYVRGVAPNPCINFDRLRILTPGDTVTVLSTLDNPSNDQGYLIVYAEDPTLTNVPIKWDWLAGTSHLLGGVDGQDFDVNPYVFKAGAALAEGAPTDVNGDGKRSFNDVEYESTPRELIVPRFTGQDASASSSLVLINLTGGGSANAVVDFLIFNDNEEAFSAAHQFTCWTRVALTSISGVFGEAFLDATNDDPAEQVFNHESGWFRFRGLTASTATATFPRPAILGALIESFQGGTGAELPFVRGTSTNGVLLQ